MTAPEYLKSNYVFYDGKLRKIQKGVPPLIDQKKFYVWFKDSVQGVINTNIDEFYNISTAEKKYPEYFV